MGKRSTFTRNPRDYYPTPYEGVLPLLPHLPNGVRFLEPCAGNGALIDHLKRHGHKCAAAWDIEPQREDIDKHNALERLCGNIDYIISNTPWDRKILHPMILHFVQMAPTWLLIDADWMHIKKSSPYMKLCRKVVSVGRLKWIPGSKYTGKDNCAWFLFDILGGDTQFIGR